jgi:hypothetical protein
MTELTREEYVVLYSCPGNYVGTYEDDNPCYDLEKRGLLYRSYEGISGFLGMSKWRRTRDGNYQLVAHMDVYPSVMQSDGSRQLVDALHELNEGEQK